ncbi:uroporphyrinogen-III synthase [Rasiella rasia]|uniref:Uroporphyrinogen-III synthase n=1 Tax=Rasiella rasia TaxID=2744027 RepID=A0A6G6GN29_9FLAO|nr:uroporphyrinogen-III synthase [Rasiella rasia]QIE59986.1 uroporphyrinogen-III synthase [Rasiella rasia]
MRVLSTKRLKGNQRDLLLGAGFEVVDYNAITIEYLDFEAPESCKNAIFTSQHAVRSILSKNISIDTSFCVGPKTKALLEENGIKVSKMAYNSQELGDFITINHKNEIFHYFCGIIRRDELPNILKEAKIDFFETKTYKTELKSKKFEQKWDGILFFSPSGVQSYCLENSLENNTAICIGDTTAKAAKEHTQNVYVANSTSVESVIAKAVKKLK